MAGLPAQIEKLLAATEQPCKKALLRWTLTSLFGSSKNPPIAAMGMEAQRCLEATIDEQDCQLVDQQTSHEQGMAAQKMAHERRMADQQTLHEQGMAAQRAAIMQTEAESRRRLEATIDERDRQLVEQEEASRQLKAAIEERDRQLEQQQTEQGHLKEALHASHSSNESLKKDLAGRKGEIETLREQVTHLREQHGYQLTNHQEESHSNDSASSML